MKPTGEFVGRGKSRRELYQVTPEGVRRGLESLPDPAQAVLDVLTRMQGTLNEVEGLRATVRLLGDKVEELTHRVHHQSRVLREAAKEIAPVDVAGIVARVAAPEPLRPRTVEQSWLDNAVLYVERYREAHPLKSCSLPELYRAVAQPLDVSIGAFHDGLRELDRAGRILLEPHYGGARGLVDDEFGLLQDREIKYYAAPGV